ncbi:hypothetical protein ACTNBM_13370 [Lachnospiraceae bacterium HCP1S3_C3]
MQENRCHNSKDIGMEEAQVEKCQIIVDEIAFGSSCNSSTHEELIAEKLNMFKLEGLNCKEL